jgi:putative iron-only hydrogenase system regulator
VNSRVGVISIIVEDGNSVETLNSILHTYGEYIIGRMGIPYRKRQVSIISVALDAPQDTIAAMAGKIGSLSGITVKTAYSNVISTDE